MATPVPIPPISLSDQSSKVVAPTLTTRTGAAVNVPSPPPGGPSFSMPTWAWALLILIPGGIAAGLAWSWWKGRKRV